MVQEGLIDVSHISFVRVSGVDWAEAADGADSRCHLPEDGVKQPSRGQRTDDSIRAQVPRFLKGHDPLFRLGPEDPIHFERSVRRVGEIVEYLLEFLHAWSGRSLPKHVSHDSSPIRNKCRETKDLLNSIQERLRHSATVLYGK